MSNIIVSNKLYQTSILTASEYWLTFFTPTYNRSKFIGRAADCLRKQTSKHFVWIIVNDGSKDDTDSVIKDIMACEDLPIKYINKPNGGKHSAFKVALEECETSFFQCMDDDDLYDPKSVDFYLNKWREIKNKQIINVGAIRTLSRKTDGSYAACFEISKEDYGKEYVATTLDNIYLNNRLMENWTCYETAKLRGIDLFPRDYWMADKHKFFDEGIWQGRFARKYSCLYVYVAFREYREDDDVSLMRREKTRQFFIDSFINSKMMLDEQYDYISRDKLSFLKRCLKINWIRSYLGIGICDLIKNTHNSCIKLGYCLAYPISFMKSYYIRRMG